LRVRGRGNKKGPAALKIVGSKGQKTSIRTAGPHYIIVFPVKCEKYRKDSTYTYELEHNWRNMTIGEILIYGFKYSYFT
jgi:hypothetical protein